MNIAPLSGSTFVTVITCTSTVHTQSALYFTWQMGDGTSYYDVSTVQHTYKFPGVYQVNCITLDVSGSTSTQTLTVSVDHYVRDSITYTLIPDFYSDPGEISDIFTISVTSTQLSSAITVDLHAANSKSTPYQYVNSKWGSITPRWRFVDVSADAYGDYTVITNKSCSTVPLTALNSNKETVVYAVSGDISFRYIDDTSTGIPYQNLPLLLNATVQTSAYNNPRDNIFANFKSYANSGLTTATVAWQVNHLTPSSLKITSHYPTPIHPLKWVGVNIPYLVTAHVKSTSSAAEAGIAYELPGDNTITTTTTVLSVDEDLRASSVGSSNMSAIQVPIFSKQDAQSINTGGYAFGTLCVKTSCVSALIASEVTYTDNYLAQQLTNSHYPYPADLRPQPIAWIANSAEGSISKVRLSCITKEFKTTPNAQLNIIYGTTKVYHTNYSKPYTSFNYQLTGENGIHYIAVSPDDNYSAIAIDSMNDCIYKYTITRDATAGSESVSVSSLLLSSLNSDVSYNSSAPASVVIDSESNIWVALFNRYDIIKLDKELKYICSTSAPYIELVVDGEYNLQSPIIETDRSNNLWVGYVSNPIRGSMIAKYTKDGTHLFSVNLSSITVPTGILVDYNDSVWAIGYGSVNVLGAVTNYNNSSIFKIHPQTGNIIKRVDMNVKCVAYLCSDRENNLWFVHGDRNIGYFNVTTYERRSWRIERDTTITHIILTQYEESGEVNEELGGLSVDAFNRIWIVDSVTNTTIVIDDYSELLSSEHAGKKTVKIKPYNKSEHYITSNNTIETIFSVNARSIFSAGDFTGNRWLQKYANRNITTFTIKGSSSIFKVLDRNDNEYQVRCVNESFDMTQYLVSLAKPDYMQDFTSFYDTIFKNIVGDSTYITDNVGSKVYERIANFVDNTADIDKCNIAQLQSLAAMTGYTDVVRLHADIPSDLQRLLDIGSIAQTNLWGSSEYPLTMNSIDWDKTKILSLSDTVYTNDLIGLQQKATSEVTLLTVPLSTEYVDGAIVEIKTFAVSSIPGYGYTLSTQKLTDVYDVYSVVLLAPTVSSYVWHNNVIDWGNEYNKLNYQLSNNNDWYGDNGTLESMFNLALTNYLTLTS